MKQIVLKFGLISAALLVGMSAITLPMSINGTLDHAEIIGYTIMVLSFLLVFFGVRSYRENVGGGAITFGKGFQVGILMVLMVSAIYVLAWEIVYYNFIPDFADKYAAHTLAKMRTSGATEQAIAATTKQMDQFKVMYKNPLFNIGMTFLEIFPVGLVVTLVSAGILRKKKTA